MNAELLALIEALDAAKQSPPSESDEGMRLKAIYESRLNDVLQRHPNLSRETLESMIARAYSRWLKAQQKPSAMPPTA